MATKKPGASRATPGGVASAGTRSGGVKAETIDDPACMTWERDQLDADNYFVIPEFGVAPAQVSFEGFRGPIVTPMTDDGFASGIRDMVRTLRRLARAQFTSLQQLRQSFRDLLDAGFPYMDVGVHGFTAQQEAAVRYSVALESLERAHRAWIEGRLGQETAPSAMDAVHRSALSMYATASSLVLGWLEGRPLQRDLQAISRLRQGSSKAGQKSGNSRRFMSSVASPTDLANLCRRRQHLVLVEGRNPRAVAGILAREFKRPDGSDYTAQYIRKLLKKCETEGRFSRV